MTLENLIQIVAEVVEQVMAQEKKQVAALVFDDANMASTRETAQEINGRVQMYTPASDRLDGADILFMDYIPLEYLAELALGFSTHPVTAYINRTILSGKKVIVLQETPGIENAPAACRNLLQCYRKMLQSYGYVFHQKDDAFPFLSAEAQVYDNNVLSREDLLNRAEKGVLHIGPSVLVTDLAAETARNLKIDIRRV